MTAKTATAGRLRLILALVGVAIVVLAALTYLNRRMLAREALTGWLKARGVASEAEVEDIGPSTFTARMRIGDPARPDFTATRVRVRYRLKGFGFEVTSVQLTKPVLRATIRDGELSVGSLDPIVEEFRRRPPRPDAAKPRIGIEDGVVLLATDYGPVRLTADALVEDGKLVRLAAVSAPARLKGPGFALDAGRGDLRLTTRGGRVDVWFETPFRLARSGALAVRDGRLQLKAAAPYPDLERRRGDGSLVLRADLVGGAVEIGDERLSEAHVAAAFTGQTAGWIPDLRVTGQATADIRADTASFGPGRAEFIRAAASAPDLTWTRAGGDRVRGTLKLTGGAERLTAGDLRLTPITVALQGPAAADADGLDLSLAGSAVGRGGWSGLGPVAAGDSAHIAAVKRGLHSFRLAAPGLSMRAGEAGFTVGLSEPLRILPDRGGAIRVAARPGAPLLGSRGGFRLDMAGGGLPETQADVRRFELTPGGALATGTIQTRLSIGPVEHGNFDASGRLRIGQGGVAFVGDRCAVVQAERLEFGANDVERLAGRLCPSGRPLLELRGGDWTIAGRAEDVRADIPFLQARVEEAEGRTVMGAARGRLHAVAVIEDARLEDNAPEARFNPLRLSGRAELARETWRSDLAVRLPGGPDVATAKLRHDVTSGIGGVDIETGTLSFAEGGLQPVQLSPLASAVGSPATGEARFTGAFAWTPQAAASSGLLAIPRLDFQSPAGRVTGLSGEIAFTSLTPLVAAPGQVLRVERLEAMAPLTDVTATFGLSDDVVRITGGEASVGGGKIRIERLDLPLGPDQPTRGVLLFEGVQLHDLVEASPFAEHVELDARVSGRVPFESRGNRVRVLGGDLRAIEPGRLSIAREALSGVKAAGDLEAPGAPVEPPAEADTFTDFAYQAMENLAFDKLEATINSREDGRLGVLFHIVGRHDPPRRQETRLTLMDLIQRRFLGRQLPLPSGTGVNLTLDTTLNLDDLLADYAEYRRLRGSGSVQP